MSHHNAQLNDKILNAPNKILLMGNPNVGKSIFFTELTGIHAMSSNYAGSTVSFAQGKISLNGEEYTLIDVPGTYSLSEPTSEAEEIAVRFAKSGAAAIICVLDASNLERNLHLAMDLRKYKTPLIYVLNLMDVAERKGIVVNSKILEKELGAPVIEAVATKKQGLDCIKGHLENIVKNQTGCPANHCDKCYKCHVNQMDEYGDTWRASKEICRKTCFKVDAKPSFLDKLGDAMVKPWPGVLLALLVMAAAIGVIVFGGRGVRFPLLMLVNDVIAPFFRDFFTSFVPEGMFLNILVGEFGIFVIAFEWILALIFPYVLMFYVAFTFLEDTGFLPRMGVLFDNVMRKMGMQGGSLIHMMMGYGCAVPAIIGTRSATTRKERLVISAAICFAIPCISQLGALMSLTAGYSWWMMPALLLFSLVLFIVVAMIASKFIKGKVDPLLIEVPNVLIPSPRAYGRKLLSRMRHFLKDAQGPMMIAILFAALLAESGILAVIADAAQPIVSGWLGLPAEAVTALILGIVRREMSVAPLLALDLTSLQAFVGGAVALMYIPCLSAFAILAKEFKAKTAIIITLSTVAVAIFIGGVINHLGRLLGA
ncbi:MAG: ferrous iron transporter B [Defluviitaleaceae bacterium]|nr:ferrous iron transporter B [Defluviitaleaceae bacterium]